MREKQVGTVEGCGCFSQRSHLLPPPHHCAEFCAQFMKEEKKEVPFLIDKRTHWDWRKINLYDTWKKRGKNPIFLCAVTYGRTCFSATTVNNPFLLFFWWGSLSIQRVVLSPCRRDTHFFLFFLSLYFGCRDFGGGCKLLPAKRISLDRMRINLHWKWGEIWRN